MTQNQPIDKFLDQKSSDFKKWLANQNILLRELVFLEVVLFRVPKVFITGSLPALSIGPASAYSFFFSALTLEMIQLWYDTQLNFIKNKSTNLKNIFFVFFREQKNKLKEKADD